MKDTLIKDIADFIFIEHELEKADIIFIPGGSYPEPAEQASKLWLEGYAPFILPSGKYSYKRGYFAGPSAKNHIYNKSYNIEWEFLKDVAMMEGVSCDAILKEDSSQSTYENAFKSRQVTDSYGLNIKKAIIFCKAFHARRSLMYYSWAYSETEFIVCPVEVQGINRNNWFCSANGIERVMGELMRCGAQFKEAITTFADNKQNCRD